VCKFKEEEEEEEEEELQIPQNYRLQ